MAAFIIIAARVRATKKAHSEYETHEMYGDRQREDEERERESALIRDQA